MYYSREKKKEGEVGIDKRTGKWYNDARGIMCLCDEKEISVLEQLSRRTLREGRAIAQPPQEALGAMQSSRFILKQNRHAGIAQSVEQLIRNQQVVSSNLISSSSPRRFPAGTFYLNVL